MGVGIVSRRMGVMDGKVNNHAFGNKLLLTKLPDEDSVLVGRYLSWDGKQRRQPQTAAGCAEQS